MAVGLGLFVGQWLDGQLHTAILFTLIGVFAGLAAASTSTIRVYRAFLRKSELDQRERARAMGPAQDSADDDGTIER